jgi:hypothetical protein
VLTRRELLIAAALAACARKSREEKRAAPTASAIEHASALMQRFAERTGLPDRPSTRRYLWTDAFAVCNFIALGRRDLAQALVARVHEVLAPKRDPAHPTASGLRIGKKLPERRADEPYDEELEWDRDGQYFHYLTQWMHALDQLAHETGNRQLSEWACELAGVAHRAFVYTRDGKHRMYWKMSIDLTRPLVTSMGQHDALDGFVTCQALAASWPAPYTCSLADAIADFRGMIEMDNLATTDPLGIGGLYIAARRLRSGELFDAVMRAAERGVQAYRVPSSAAEGRLAFRELGLAIGLAAVDAHATLRDEIVRFWLDPAQQTNDTWREHEDINEVMLATALVPDGFLVRA